MTISTEAYFTDWFAANGSNKNWAYDFTIFLASHVYIEVRDGFDDDTIVKYTSDFTLVPANAEFSAGYVVFPSAGDALVAGKQLRLIRDVPYTQEREIGREGSFSPKIHEQALDFLTLQTQQLAGTLARTPQVPLGEPGLRFAKGIPDGVLLAKEGNVIVEGPSTGDISLLTFQVAAVNADAAAAAIAADQAEAALQAFFNEVDSQYVIKLKTVTTAGVLLYTLTGSMPAVNGHLHVNVLLNDKLLPKDGIAYTITDAGAKILLASDPGVTSLYVEGAAIYAAYDVDSSLASLVTNDSSVVGASVKNALETLNAKTYAASQTTNDSGVGGANVAVALNTLNAKTYNAGQIANSSAVTGANVEAALNTLNAKTYAASVISNDSGVGGASVAAALNTLNAKTYSATQITNNSAVAGASVAAALNTLGTAVAPFTVWPPGVYRTLQDRSKRECHVLDFDVDPTGANDSTAGLLLWNTQAQNSHVPAVVGRYGTGLGIYTLGQELEITRPGHVMRFDGTGLYTYSSNPGLQATGTPYFKAFGAWFAGAAGSRVRTRRKHRPDAGTTPDPVMSAVINIQAQGVRLENVSILLNDDYTNMSPGVYGDDIDNAIFVGQRAGVKIISPRIVGHFRRAGIFYDVTYQSNLDRLLSVAGTPYPDYNETSAGDQCTLYEPYIRGAWHGISVEGANPAAGESDYDPAKPYYDGQLGATIADARGSGGFSDFTVYGGHISSVDHRSGRRAADPVLDGGALTQTGINNSAYTLPACVYIDGLAGNADDVLWNMAFYRTRFVSGEAFRVRLGRVSRIQFDHCHWDRGGATMTTGGVALNDPDIYSGIGDSWGAVASNSAAKKVKILNTPFSSLSGGLAPHYYGDANTLFYETHEGKVQMNTLTTKGAINAASLVTTGQVTGNGIASTAWLSAATTVVGGSFQSNAGLAFLATADTGMGHTFKNGVATSFVVPYTSGGLNASSTATSANLAVIGGSIIAKNSSSGKVKTGVETLDAEHRDLILKLRPVYYRSLCELDNPAYSYYGFIAEEVAEVDPRLVHWDEDYATIETRAVIVINSETGKEVEAIEQYEVWHKKTPEPNGVMYDRLTTHLVAMAQIHERRIAELEARFLGPDPKEGEPA